MKLGDCHYCGEPIYFVLDRLLGAHEDCRSRYIRARGQIVDAVSTAASTSDPSIKLLKDKVTTIADSNYVHKSEVIPLILEGWEAAIEKAVTEKDFADQTVAKFLSFSEFRFLPKKKMSNSACWSNYSEKRREQLVEVTERKRLQAQEIAQRKAQRKRRKVQQRIIDDIRNGLRIEPNVAMDNTPINFQKSESLIWIFPESEYLKEVVVQRRRHSKWGVIPTIFGMESIDRGTVGLTTKHIYFVGGKERFRIRYDRVVSFVEYNDGLGLTRGAEKARHQMLVTGDGWFTYQLVTNLAKLA